MDDFAAATAAVLDAEGVDGAVVAGHSLGGLVALRLARTRPDLVRGLLLVAPAGIATTSRVVEALVLASAAIRPGRAVARFRHRWADRVWYRRALFRPWFVSDPVALTPRATHGLLSAQARHTDTKVAGRAMIADDPRQDLPDIACPVVVALGRAGRAAAARGCLRVRAPAAREAAPRRRLRASGDRRAAHAVLDALAELAA